VCLMTLWAAVVDARAPFAAVLQSVAIGLFFALYSGRRSLAWRRSGLPPVMAHRRALEQACGQAFAGTGAVVALLPGLIAWPGTFVFVIGGLIAVVAATVSVPAAVTAFEVLTPRRRSVEDLYGPRKKPVHP
jgi:hypothetical protein